MGLGFKKVAKDLLSNKTRTILVILSISLGVFGLGLILDVYSILDRKMDKSYSDTKPASFSIKSEEMPDAYLKKIEGLEGIELVEARSTLRGRTQLNDGTWLTSYLFVVDDFNTININTFFPEKGSSKPALGEILIEKESLKLLDMNIEDSANIKISLNEKQSLRIVGSVHAPGLKPAWMDKTVYGFISQETLDYLGTPSEQGDILFRVEAFIASDKQAVTDLAFSIRDTMIEDGYAVDRVSVSEPEEHPNGDQTTALLFLFQVFGVLSLVLSAVLVVNLISSMLSGQVRQIAIMKATGARRLHIAKIYCLMILILGALALALALPAAVTTGQMLVDICASMLNFSVSDYSIPWWIFAVQIVVGLVVPLLAATYPILKGTGVPINAALQDYGTSAYHYEGSVFDRFLEKIKAPSTLVLGVRNAFRKKRRTVFSILTLAVGGAIFIVSMNVNASLGNTMTKAMESLDYDLQYYFSKPYPEVDIEQAVSKVSGIASEELFAGVMATMQRGDGTEKNAFQLTALRPDTKTLNFTVLEGRWLEEGDTNAVILNHSFADSEPGVKVGEEISFKASGKEFKGIVVGIVKEVGANEKAYMSYDYYQEVFSQNGYGRLTNIVLEERTAAKQEDVASLLETEFKEAGLDVMISGSFAATRDVFDNHIVLIAGFLVVASGLVIIVGVMGLVSSMSMNAMERARETGIMRAFGARSGNLLSVSLVECLNIALISWVFASLLSIPLGFVVGDMFGNIFLKTPLDNLIDPFGYLLWLAVVVILSALIGIGATLKTLDAPVHEVLKYE